MLKRILNISLAYVGVVIGAGLSSGQDLIVNTLSVLVSGGL